MPDAVRIKTGVAMNSVSGSKIEHVVEIPRAEWDAMTDAEREERLDGIAEETITNNVDAWAYVEGEDQ